MDILQSCGQPGTFWTVIKFFGQSGNFWDSLKFFWTVEIFWNVWKVWKWSGLHQVMLFGGALGKFEST